MLYGAWLEDARIRLRKMLGNLRADVIGDPDLSANPFRALCSAVAALYDHAPEVTHTSGAELDVESMRSILAGAGYWSMMQRVQRDCIGMREMLVRVDVSLDETGQPVAVYRPVPPDMVECDADNEEPERPVEVRELRRYVVRGTEMWVREVWSIADPSAPYHRIYAAESAGGLAVGQDISEFCGLPESGLTGEAYPARKSTGAPILPYAVYHASRTGALWDSWEGIEIVEGTLQVSSHWTLYGHFLRHASWAQRYVIGAEPAGHDMEGEGTSERRAVPSDASFVAQLVSTGDGQPMVGQWSVTVDPVAFAESIGIYERRLAAFAGLDPSDVQRVSGDPRSGYALAISREGKREAQRRYAPIFKPSDEEICRITAVLVNVAVGAPVLPESGWKVEYYGLKDDDNSNEEKDHQPLGYDGLIKLYEAGIITKEQVLAYLAPSFGDDNG